MFEVEDEKKKVKVLRKITKLRLKNIALYYLKRFESSVANLKSVLMRRVNDYAYHNPDFEKNDAIEWIDEILADFVRLGYIDDERYANIKIKSYIRSGKSPRYIKGKLKEKGIDGSLIDNLLDDKDYDVSEAVLKLARKKKIGPYRVDEEERLANRQKDMVKLVQAGFDYDVVVEVMSVNIDE